MILRLVKNWIAPLLESMEDKKIAACQPKIKSLEQKDLFEHAGASGGFIDKNYFLFVEVEYSQNWKKMKDNMTAQFITWTSGAAMLIRAELFHKADGFDCRFLCTHGRD